MSLAPFLKIALLLTLRELVEVGEDLSDLFDFLLDAQSMCSLGIEVFLHILQPRILLSCATFVETLKPGRAVSARRKT